MPVVTKFGLTRGVSHFDLKTELGFFELKIDLAVDDVGEMPIVTEKAARRIGHIMPMTFPKVTLQLTIEAAPRVARPVRDGLRPKALDVVFDLTQVSREVSQDVTLTLSGLTGGAFEHSEQVRPRDDLVAVVGDLLVIALVARLDIDETDLIGRKSERLRHVRLVAGELVGMLNGPGFVFDNDCKFVVDDTKNVYLSVLSFNLNLMILGMRIDETKEIDSHLMKRGAIGAKLRVSPCKKPTKHGVL